MIFLLSGLKYPCCSGLHQFPPPPSRSELFQSLSFPEDAVFHRSHSIILKLFFSPLKVTSFCYQGLQVQSSPPVVYTPSVPAGADLRFEVQMGTKQTWAKLDYKARTCLKTKNRSTYSFCMIALLSSQRPQRRNEKEDQVRWCQHAGNYSRDRRIGWRVQRLGRSCIFNKEVSQ